MAIISETTFKNSYADTIKENMGLSVYNTGFQRCEPGYGCGPVVHDHYLIHYISSGEGWYSCEGRMFHLTSGDLFLIYPSKMVSYHADEKSPWEYYWVGFNGGDSDRLLGMTDFTRDHPVIRCKEQDNRYPEILMQIYEQRGSKSWNDAEMTGKLYHFLGVLIKDSCSQAEKNRYSCIYIENALRFIQCNYTTDLSVENIAGYVGLSRSYLCKLFKAALGISLKEYLLNYRINQACGLLRKSDMTISLISYSVGFRDPLYFTRAFKKNKGMTPSEMKKTASIPVSALKTMTPPTCLPKR